MFETKFQIGDRFYKINTNTGKDQFYWEIISINEVYKLEATYVDGTTEDKFYLTRNKDELNRFGNTFRFVAGKKHIFDKELQKILKEKND